MTLSSTCFEHPSFHPQEDLHMQFYGIAFMQQKQLMPNYVSVKVNGNNRQCLMPPTRLFIWMHKRITIKLHVEVFLRMNNLMFEICRRHCN